MIGETLEQRKAAALHQLAVASGTSPETHGSARERQIQAVKSILDENGIPYEIPQASQDWRLLVLVRLLGFGIPVDGLLVDHRGLNDGDTLQPSYGTGDFTPKQSAALLFDGIGDFGDTGVVLSGSSGTMLLKVDATDQGKYSEYMGTIDVFPTKLGLGLVFHNGLKRPYFTSSLGTAGTAVGGGFVSSGMTYIAGIWDWDGVNTTVSVYWSGQSALSSAVYTGQVSHSVQTLKLAARGDTGEIYPSYGGCAVDARIYDRALSKAEIDALIETDLIAQYPLAETAGNIFYDVVGGRDGTLTSTSGITTMRAARRDDVHYNLFNGYSLYEHASTADILVPYGKDGNPITVTPPSGYSKTYDMPGISLDNLMMHNGCETLLLMDDIAALKHIGLLSADGITMDNLSFATAKAWISGTDNGWVDFATNDDDVCIWRRFAGYEESKNFTAREITRLNQEMPNECGAGSLNLLIDANDKYLLDADDNYIIGV